jgi:mannosyltransferase OCH1-like enzyme
MYPRYRTVERKQTETAKPLLACLPMSAQLPIVQYWDTLEPPDYIVELTSSFAKLNPDRPHILFNKQTADEFIAKHFTGRESAAFRACGPAAMQADYLRYCAVLHFGGVWADAGFVCARNLSPLLNGSLGGELFISFLSPYALMNGFFAFALPRHPFLRLAVDLATELINMRWKGVVSTVTGPLIGTSIFGLYRAGSVDDFLREVQKKAPNLLPFAHLICELIGGHAQVAKACQGIRVHPPEYRVNWARRTGKKLPHHTPDRHWRRMGTDIYVENDGKM